jgi:asparagine synthase (glutamine-hydrolysing)
MSGFVAIIDPNGGLLDESSVAPMLATLTQRGDRIEVRRTAETLFAVARFDWEMADEFSGDALLVTDGDISVATDASVYYRDDLVRALAARGVRPSGRSAAHLVAAAYRAWGTDCPRYLEADYAFVVYDHAQRRTFAARDFMGRRPLYYAEIGGGLLVGSMVSALVAHPRCSRELDDVALAEVIGVSLAGHERTPYLSVSAVPAATSLVREASGESRRRAYWTVELSDEGNESFDTAAERLRDLLGNAMLERRALSGPTTIWLSGGYDSPVMYAVGNAAYDKRGFSRLAPVSFSYPVGDPGREDELITEVTTYWDARPVWLSIDDVPLLANAEAHAARADIPFPHSFENWIRALLGATARQNSRVALYGDGGDQLFAVSTVFLQDLLTGLRWRELRREWRAFGGSGVRTLWRVVARPLVDQRLRRLKGERASDTPLPPWLKADFVSRHGIDSRHADAETALASGGGGEAALETRRSLGNPTVPRVLTGLSAFALEHGVEMRAPLLDQRIVDFALCRPRAERASAGAVKHLLRRAARDLLPPSVLAPRSSRTGVLTGYFARSFRADPGGLVSDVFSRSILAERGVIDGAMLQQAWREYKSNGGSVGAYLFVLLQVELWLHARAKMPGNGVVMGPREEGKSAAGFVQ